MWVCNHEPDCQDQTRYDVTYQRLGVMDENGNVVEVKPGRSAAAGAAKAQLDKVEAQLAKQANKASLKTLRVKLAEIKERNDDPEGGDDIRARVIRRAIKAKSK